MIQTDIPDADHIVRYVPWSFLRRDENKNVLGILPQALRLRTNEQYLSMTWVEHFSADYEQGIQKSVTAVRTLLNLGKKSRILIGNVGKFRQVCTSFELPVQIIHEPIPKNTGHVAIYQLPENDIELQNALIDDVFQDVRLTSSIP